MPSDTPDHRLHPLSILFSFGNQLRSLAIPGLLVLVGAGTSGANWELWALLLLIPYTIVASVRYLSFRYRYEANEMVISTGLIFKNQRHVPYARIQNIDAVQNVVHRLFGVADVRVQTAGGQEPEAVMRVLPLAAFEEMRRRVFENRRPADAPEGVDAPVTAAPTLLHLPVRELILCGLIENRGAVIITASFGLIWEIGLFDGIVDRVFGEEATGRGIIRDLFRSVYSGASVAAGRIALTALAFAGLLLAVRIISMVWAFVRLYDFRLSLVSEDLRSEYGLLTRVTATIPLGRIQTLIIRESPLHRLFGRVSVKVQTAGGSGEQTGTAEREWLAPIIRRTELPAFLRQVLPELAFTDVGWKGVAAGAYRREIKVRLVIGVVVLAGLIALLRWWTLALIPPLVLWAVVDARLYVRNLGWATEPHDVLFRSGWLWRKVCIARYSKIQAVAIHESPFNRRAAMARVSVDTAGAHGESSIDIPYLLRDTARQVHDALGAEAARTEFRW